MSNKLHNENNFEIWCKNNNQYDLYSEWNYTKNGDLLPSDISAGSHKRIWWKCKTCGYEWETELHNRTKSSPTGCPICGKIKQGVSRSKADKDSNLSILFPQLLSDWDYNKNEQPPSFYKPKSNKKVWWKCHICGHEWETAICHRTRGSGCPKCGDINRNEAFHSTMLSKKKSLAQQCPEVVAEWHPTKNGDLLPSDVLPGSHQKVWWLGKCGHEWEASIKSRVNGNGCRICWLNSQTSFPEKAIQYYVRKEFSDAVSNDRKALDGKECDIFIPSCNVAIEYDGEVWHKDKEKDEVKNRICKDKRITLYRIREKNCPALSDNEYVYTIIVDYGNYRQLSDAIKQIFAKLSVQYNFSIDIENDENDILESYVLDKKDNSLLVRYPEIAKEWHPTKNGRLQPKDFSYGSNKKVWWKCKTCGYEWEASISNRTKPNGTGCMKCSDYNNSVIEGKNDLATKCPHLLEEWDYEKNIDLDPSCVSYASAKKVWWKCKTCGYEWEASLSHRSNGRGCPKCARASTIKHHSTPKEGQSFFDLYPELISEWDYSKNTISPKEINPHSSHKVWWKCKTCGHEWETSICHRTRGRGCPQCAINKRAKARSKAVINVDTGDIYISIAEASRKTGVERNGIYLCCNGKLKTSGGYHWKYKE